MKIDSIAPLCLFVYKRPGTLKKTIAALTKNNLAASTDIYIFSDAPAKQADFANVSAVREYIAGIKGFKSVTIYLAEKNKGLARSIIDGVSKIIPVKGKVIVLEDDLLVAPNFLDFMNQALQEYQHNEKIFSVSGYSSPVRIDNDRDVYFTRRASSWGWATWKTRWVEVDWSVSDFDQFNADIFRQRQFNKMGSDLTGMLKKQMNGTINSWAIRWVYHQFKYDLLTVFPLVSKVTNNGFHDEATHTEKINESRFMTQLDRSGKRKFNFLEHPGLDKRIVKQFVAPYTLRTRIFYKLKSILHF